MDMKELPIGVQTFDKIIEGGYMYVDKTGYVYEIANKFEYVFLSRPRRFGKSMTTKTFRNGVTVIAIAATGFTTRSGISL